MTKEPTKTIKTRGQKRAAKTRNKLKEAALDVFSEKGVEAATVEDITQKADLGKGTLYRYFADKEEVVITLVEDAIDHLIEQIRSYPEKPETMNDVLEHFLDAHYDFFMNNGEEFILLFQGRLFLKLQSDSAEELEELYLRYLKEIEKHVSQYITGGIDPDRVRRLACAVAGFISGYFSFAMIGMNDDEIELSIIPLKKSFVNSLCIFLDQD